ncbi:MAG: DivIVA domain-containing protein, partial [Acidimicrobiia bacterium]
MALDFQRPDPSSPAAVASAQFTVTRRGYREDEVRDFLRQVSVELGRLIERERFLENELKALAARGPVDVSAIDEAAVAELLGAEAARVLSAAREAAQAMRDRAAESAEQIVREATREAARMLEESTLEASRRRTDVSSEAEQEIELAKQQGREMVAEVRAYRERVLADLAKRTEEARRELERLVHERERLLGAFERARHAATDVVGDLNEFDQAIRETGIVPPLVPPDAPPPPRPTRRSDTPIFDAKQYEDELGAAHREEEAAADQQGDDVARGDVVRGDVNDAPATAGGSSDDQKPALTPAVTPTAATPATPTAATPEITSTPTPPSTPLTKVDTGTAASLEAPAQE